MLTHVVCCGAAVCQHVALTCPPASLLACLVCCCLQELSNMLWAFAKLGVRPDAAWMLDWLAAMQARMDRWVGGPAHESLGRPVPQCVLLMPACVLLPAFVCFIYAAKPLGLRTYGLRRNVVVCLMAAADRGRGGPGWLAAAVLSLQLLRPCLGEQCICPGCAQVQAAQGLGPDPAVPEPAADACLWRPGAEQPGVGAGCAGAAAWGSMAQGL